MYRSYLKQSDVFVAVYWQQYGWIAPGENVSGLEDEYNLSRSLPSLIYVKEPAPERDARLEALLERVRNDDSVSYKVFAEPGDLEVIVSEDLAVLLTERFHVAADAASDGGGRRASTVPYHLSTLVGRDRELSAVREALVSSRLVTITGVAGVGKTRLAAEVAREVEGDGTEDVWWCDLSSARTDDEVPTLVSSTLELSGRSADALTQGVVDYLRHRRALVVLDNCEHVAEGAAVLAAEVLHRCPGLVILATGRQGLSIEGERRWPLRPLGHDDSLQLFIQRARAIEPDFSTEESDHGSLHELTRLLDGIPLALELAAARVVALSPAEIVTRLGERFRLLGGDRRVGLERHRTLRAAIDWSYSLLTDVERRVFTALGVFVGATVGSMSEVVNELDDWVVLDTLTSLVAKSMVVRELTPGSAGVRYKLLVTLREYALDRLHEAGETDEFRRRHAASVAALAERIGPALLGPEEVASRMRLSAELDDMRAAVSWSLESGRSTDADHTLRIVTALTHEAMVGSTSGIGSWAHRAVAVARDSTSVHRTSVLAAAAWFIIRTHTESLTVARDLAAEALRDDPPRDCLGFHLAWGALAIMALDWDDAAFESFRTDAVRAFEDGRVAPFAGAFVHGILAFSAVLRGDSQRARPSAERSLELAVATRNPTQICGALSTMANLCLSTDPDEALRLADESIALTEGGASAGVIGHMQALRAQVYADKGDSRTALSSLRESIDAYRDSDDLNLFGTALDRGVRVMSTLDEHRLVALFHGFLSRDRPRTLSIVPSNERPDRERAIEAARRAIGPRDFDAAFTRGLKLPPRDMADQAVAELDRMLDM